MTSITSSGPELATITIGADLHVSRIGYGAMQLTGDHVWGEYPDRDGAIDLLRAVVQSGITFIDTADVYGPHTNETLIHDALHPYPDGLVIATKGSTTSTAAPPPTCHSQTRSRPLRSCARRD